MLKLKTYTSFLLKVVYRKQNTWFVSMFDFNSDIFFNTCMSFMKGAVGGDKGNRTQDLSAGSPPHIEKLAP